MSVTTTIGLLAVAAAPAQAASFKVLTLPPGTFPNGIAATSDGSLWLADGPNNAIDRLTPGGAFIAYPLPTEFSGPNFPTVGPDGNVWFAEEAGKIGRLTLDGALTEFRIPSRNRAFSVVVGPDGNLWFAETYGRQIGRMTLDGTFAEFPIIGEPVFLAAGPDGNVWFTESYQDRVGRVGVDGENLTLYPLPSDAGAASITGGPDGNVWFGEGSLSRIVKITPDGQMTAYSVQMDEHYLASLIWGPQDKIWFLLPHDSLPGQDAMGTITTDGEITRTALPTEDGQATGLTVNWSRSALWIANRNTSLIRVTAG